MPEPDAPGVGRQRVTADRRRIGYRAAGGSLRLRRQDRSERSDFGGSAKGSDQSSSWLQYTQRLIDWTGT